MNTTTTTKQLPRGLRNRNPLNIRRTGDDWQGKSWRQEDPDFIEFEHLRWGYRAAWILMLRYWQHFNRLGVPCTLRNVISRWAPPTDGNDTEAYIKFVSMQASIGGQERLPCPNTRWGLLKFTPILKAMTCVECGIKPYEVDVDTIRESFTLAFPEVDLTETDEEDEEFVVFEELDEDLEDLEDYMLDIE